MRTIFHKSFDAEAAAVVEHYRQTAGLKLANEFYRELSDGSTKQPLTPDLSRYGYAISAVRTCGDFNIISCFGSSAEQSGFWSCVTTDSPLRSASRAGRHQKNLTPAVCATRSPRPCLRTRFRRGRRACPPTGAKCGRDAGCTRVWPRCLRARWRRRPPARPRLR